MDALKKTMELKIYFYSYSKKQKSFKKLQKNFKKLKETYKKLKDKLK